MGFWDTWEENAPREIFKGGNGVVTLYAGRVEFKPRGLGGAESIPLGEVELVEVEDGAALESRITATRLVLVGVFALAFRKKRGGEKWLSIAGGDKFWAVEVDRKKVGQAMKFAAKLRSAVAQA